MQWPVRFLMQLQSSACRHDGKDYSYQKARNGKQNGLSNKMEPYS